ncbi:tRNA preQ1(34) S-adenosylmethionine ribosyltransferase-isomerase QueA [Pseudoruegeria sp. SK021]|uniref:tRNA preQ1(34) S-adenosylmethionine ribosyltransferase-isomerase QueA n=1 Tax=Pseudoruegeria sp. SK021 TaxID=1933035 RepID=UPI000A230D2D|nr:tRNA preQ1(34) S-adenosylmethionine ribosyltransferase-isomerase QueA [Pseudoruegeria sp. SK021]OSP56231.1 tRNA preQ1(34) S-adenosylmethionine ribosyltransferase-isomerase QueA [Pseudoruegeria sp. SK021]
MTLDDFDFDLPDALIATRPVKPRSSARLLVATDTGIEDRHVFDLPEVLRPGDRLVLNDTKVLPARLSGTRHRIGADGTGVARIEVTLLDPQGDGTWQALVKPLRKIRDGEDIVFNDQFSAKIVGRGDGGLVHLALSAEGDALTELLDATGSMPLPPYIASKRAADAQDKDDYQTVFARHIGAVAAPTASLHFDQDLLDALARRGVTFSHVTLHVGAGTFLPVKVEDPRNHKMHSEWGEVSAQAAAEIAATRAAGGRIIPVGTTALRLIETAARETGQVAPWSGPTDIFIYPGFSFRASDALMTNFHLPKSTLMMLVSALMGTDRVRQIYAHALERQYRFFSYGDASILFPKDPPTAAL